MVIKTSNTKSILYAVIETSLIPKKLTIGGHLVKPQYVTATITKQDSQKKDTLRIKVILENQHESLKPYAQTPEIDYFEFTKHGDHVTDYKDVEINFYDEYDYSTNIIHVEELK